MKNKIFVSLSIIVVVILLGAGAFMFVNKDNGLEPTPITITENKPATNTDGSINEPTKTPEKPLPIESLPPQNIPTAHNLFGLDLIKAIEKDEPTKNIFISPTSISLALSMLYNGTAEQTKTEIQKVLHLEKIDDITLNKESLGLIKNISSPDSKIKLAIANSVWTKKQPGLSFEANFINTLKNYFQAESYSLDFTNSDSVKTINNWASKNTNGKIPTIIDSIPGDTVMYIINAVYFKGGWTKEFEKKLTTNREFTSFDKTKANISTMKKDGSLPYLETADFQSVKLNYGENGKISMYVFLPKDINSFVTSLAADKMNSWFNQYQNSSGTLFLPKFKIEYKKALIPTLKQLGMNQVFTASANLKKISTNTPLMVSEVLHKTFVDVNEEGTEAAAVTSIGFMTTSIAPPTKTFLMDVNRPFFFVIRDNISGELLFTGIIKSLK